MYREWYSWFNPWTAARNILKPASADYQGRFHRISDLRAVVGLVCVVVLSLPLASVSDDVIALERMISSTVSFVASSLIAFIVVVAYCCGHVHGLSGARWRAAGLVLVRVLTSLAVIGAFIVLTAKVGDGGPSILSPSLVVFGGMFGIAAIWYSLHWVFGIGDLHPPLAPLVASATAIAAYVADSVFDLMEDPRDDMLLGTALKVGALVSICTVSAFEWRDLRKRRLPDGSWPEPVPRPAVVRQPGNDYTDLLAWTAFMLAWCLPPIGFGFAVESLRCAKRHHRASHPMAVVALVLSIPMTVLSVVAYLAGWAEPYEGGDPAADFQ